MNKSLILAVCATGCLTSLGNPLGSAPCNDLCTQSGQTNNVISVSNCNQDELKEKLGEMGINYQDLINCPGLSQLINGEVSTQGTCVPKTCTPGTSAPNICAPKTCAPETCAPKTCAPETCAPETCAPETCAPETTVPETKVPETAAPETTVPETKVPETTVPETSIPETESKPSTGLTYVEQVVNLVNQERTNRGLTPLTLDNSIKSAAQVRAKEIEISFAHTRPNGSSFSTVLSEQGVSFRGAGENIAYGQRSPEEVMQGWMNSSGHRANILNANYTKIGVGYYQNSRGVNYWSQLFTY